MIEELRIDKFLWAVRIYKTRTQAAEACGKSQVTVNGTVAKPSRDVRTGDEIMVRKPPIIRTYKVLGLLNNRLSADKVKEYIEEVTPSEEFLKLEMARMQKSGTRDRGTGRPTKRDRRDIDRIQDDV